VTTYRHTQTGYAIIYALLVPAFIACAVATVSPTTRVALIPAAILLLSGLLFWKLTIEIDHEILRASFGLGLVRKTTRVADVASCEPIRIRWWYGWGIHLTPYGWLYNVSGWDAVAITLRNGRRFSLGTDDPQGLTAAIRRLASAK
jgi:hypothetical protein